MVFPAAKTDDEREESVVSMNESIQTQSRIASTTVRDCASEAEGVGLSLPMVAQGQAFAFGAHIAWPIKSERVGATVAIAAIRARPMDHVGAEENSITGFGRNRRRGEIVEVSFEADVERTGL